MTEGIAGVIVTDLKLVSNERGGLMEVQRCDDPQFPGFGQVYVTRTFSGVVKAWYRHRRQVDQIAAVAGAVKLVLYDDRDASPSRGRLQEIFVGADAPRLVQIPPMVWHGFMAIGRGDALILHLNDRPFDFAAPDEERRASDDGTIPYSW